MTYRETIMDNLLKTKEEISTTKSASWNSASKVCIHVGYIDKALKLLEQDREKIDTLSGMLNRMWESNRSVKPKSGIFLCLCGNCGNQMQKSDLFCSKCGKEINWG